MSSTYNQLPRMERRLSYYRTLYAHSVAQLRRLRVTGKGSTFAAHYHEAEIKLLRRRGAHLKSLVEAVKTTGTMPATDRPQFVAREASLLRWYLDRPDESRMSEAMKERVAA